MRIAYIFFLLFIPGLIFPGEIAILANDKKGEPAETVYYINTQEDFDNYSNTVFPAGSKVLFAAGESFKGRFILRGSGTEAAPNLAATYSSETGDIYSEWTDNKALIKGEGKVSAALKLYNGSYWEINNIEVTNTDGSDNQQGDIVGILVEAKDIGLASNISVKNCHVHDVNGAVGGKETGGIHVNVEGKSVQTKYHNVIIENNLVSHIGGVGISNQSSYGSIYADDYYPWTGYVIRGNRVEYTGRNGIIARYSVGTIVEYNVAAYNSRYDVGHSIFNFNTIDCTVQYNEAYGNTSDDPGEVDRGGFDCDFNSRNTIYQYNYSHDNHWFMAIQQRSLVHNVIIRYNVSENERLGAYMYGFPEYDDLRGLEIYNNTHYFGKGTGTKMFMEIGKQRIPTQTTFTNNIFYFEDAAEWVFDPDSTCSLANNLFYNVAPKGENAVTEDPMFVNPGHGGTDIDMTDPNRLSGYRLKTGSPAINAGKEIQHGGADAFGGIVDRDIAGSQVPAGPAPDIGAFERQYDQLSATIVVKDETGASAVGAAVETGDDAPVTLDETGTATFSDLESPGMLPVIVSFMDYPVHQSGVDPYSQDTVFIHLSKEKYSLIMHVKSQSGNPVSNAMVALAAIDTLYTNANGEVVFENVTSSDALYAYISKEGFHDVYTTYSLKDNETFELMLNERWAGLSVIDADGNAVTGATVTTEQHGVEVTDEKGIVRFMGLVTGDTLHYTVIKEGQLPYEGEIVVSEQNNVKTITLEPVKLNFYILDETLNPLSDASVLFMDQVGFADESGLIQFYYIPFEDSLDFSAYSSGFITYRGTVFITETGENVFVKMKRPALIDVLFSVSDANNNPLENATVKITGFGTMNTDAEGKALFTDLEESENFSFSISCDGYLDTTGYFTAGNQDIQLEITLQSSLSNVADMKECEESYLELTAAPEGEIVNIRIFPQKGFLFVLDMTGKLVHQSKVMQHATQINLGNKRDNIYLFHHIDEYGIPIQVHKLLL